MWVEFLRPWLYTPAVNRRASIEYPAGWRGNVRRECGDAAIAAGAAVAIDPPRREPVDAS